MKKIILQNNCGYHLTIKNFDDQQLSGTLVVNTPEICSSHEINSNCLRVSDSLYHLFFYIQKNEDYLKSLNYTLFNGKLLLKKMNKVELILNWFCVYNKYEEDFKIGEIKLSNYKTKNYKSNPYDSYPFPL